jgi:hypothetical protein
VAEQQQSTFGEVIERGLDLIRQERFWSQVAALIPDAAYREEFRAWSDTDMTDEEHTNGQSATR